MGVFASGTWSRDGVILFADFSRIIRRVSAAGTSAPVLPLDESRKESGQLGPQFLPDGRRFLYYSFAQQNGVGLGTLDGKSRFLMVNPDSPGLYAPSREGKEYLLFLRRDQLMAQPFDAGTAAVRGEPVSIAEPLQPGGPSFSASENGVLIFRRIRGGRQLTWFDREGKPLGTAGDAGIIFGPRISPDQKSVVFFQADGIRINIWLFDKDRGNSTRFTIGPDTSSYPVWSPDGSRIAYYMRRSNETFVIERSASGMGKETVLYRSLPTVPYFPDSWSRDGRWLVLMTPSSGAFLPASQWCRRIGWRSQAHSSPGVLWRRPQPVSLSGLALVAVLLHADGKPGSLPPEHARGIGRARGPIKRQVSIAGGTQPAWRADDKEIFYLGADGKMMSVSVELGTASFKLGKAIPLFQTRLESDVIPRQYDVSADGKRFLLAQPLEGASVPISVIVNWPELLKKEASAL
jgi:hypothetical protein